MSEEVTHAEMLAEIRANGAKFDMFLEEYRREREITKEWRDDFSNRMVAVEGVITTGRAWGRGFAKAFVLTGAALSAIAAMLASSWQWLSKLVSP